MAIDQSLLDNLVCPETKLPVTLADDSFVKKINTAIKEGKIQNRGNQKVTQKIDGALVRSDKKLFYPIRQDIPIMLVDESIELESHINLVRSLVPGKMLI